MRVFDYSFDAPAENLALDEVLLERAESGEGGECLRFWESPVPFVVLGLTQAVDRHVITDACHADGVSIQRRCTAGGCVLQAPGCLNYAFVLRMDRHGCDTIHGSYRVILGWIAAALGGIDHPASHAGISDLALGANKVSGNAQKRKRRFLLHHGTLLYAFDASLCAKYLKLPPDQPEYRAQRAHEAFMQNLSASRSKLIEAVSRMFQGATGAHVTAAETDQARSLATEKYCQDDWVRRR